MVASRLAGPASLDARAAGRDALLELARQGTSDGEKSRQLLALEQEDGGDGAEPRSV